MHLCGDMRQIEKSACGRQWAAFTLVELVFVVAILAIVATVAVGRYARLAESTRVTVAEAELTALREAFLADEGGYLHDLEGIPGFSVGYLRVANLFMPTNVFGCRAVDGGVQGIRLDDNADAARCRAEGRALPAAFTSWDDQRGRGWRGPYVRRETGVFPARNAVRFAGDATFEQRQFFPNLAHLLVPAVFQDSQVASIYGFVGEPACFDPWGNPYVIQIPPPQAFAGVTNVSARARFKYARLVSAGPDGILQTPCFGANTTNFWGATGWNARRRCLSRQAGLIDGTDRSARGDDLVLFFARADIDEGVSE